MSQLHKELDLDLQNIYNSLIFSKDKKEELSTLEKKFPNVPYLKERLLKNPQSFWVSKITADAWEICPKVEIQLCYLYNVGSCGGTCGKLHMCKQNILSSQFCSSPCKHGYSHDINDNYNHTIVSKLFPSNFNHTGGKMHILRSSFPRICKPFTEKGICTKEFCGYLHICEDFINETCVNDCKQAKMGGVSKSIAHDFSNHHNKLVLTSFGISLTKEDRNHRLANILVGSNLVTPSYKSAYSTKPKLQSLNQFPQKTTTKKEKNNFGQWRNSTNHEIPRTHNQFSQNTVKNQTVPRGDAVSLCFYYLNKTCTNRECPRLHLCKDYLVDEILCTGGCKYSHEPLDRHNKSIIDKIRTGLSKKQALKLVKKHSTQLCENYIFSKCQWGSECLGIHICGNVLINTICKVSGCTKSHDLWDAHNKRFASNWNIKNQITDYFITDILFSKNKLQKQLYSEEEDASHLVSRVNIKEHNVIASSENDVFNYILDKSKDASVSIEKVLFMFNNDKQAAEIWFNNHILTFRKSVDKEGVTVVHLCLENVMPCYYYWSSTGCNGRQCKMFHICKKYLFGLQHPEYCNFDHDIESVYNSSLSHEYNLQYLSAEKKLVLLRHRYPVVCKDYLKSNCTYSTCPNVHVCGDFLEGRCNKIDGLCSFKHQLGLFSEHEKRLMADFHLCEDKFHQCIVSNKEEEEKPHNSVTKTAATAIMKADFNAFKEEAICYDFINDLCLNGMSCKLIHPDPKLPYLWQCSCGGDWKSFPPKLNYEIENCFCNPMNDSFDSTALPGTEEMLLNIDFTIIGPTLKGSYNGDLVDIRRLSTKSSVLSSEDMAGLGLTKWKWYWEMHGTWEIYRNWTSSELIENAYLSANEQEAYFHTHEFAYSVSFEKMEQKNLDPDHLTVRRARRRPVFVDIEKLSKSKGGKIGPVLPSHWPTNAPDGSRITVQDESVLSEIKKAFLTLGPSCRILSVEEVCNSTFYLKFQNVKSNFIRRLGEDNINDLCLFHGTSKNVVDQICAQNFDWRLCGAHGTSYGQGSYFTKNLRYGHKFAKPDANGEHWMFMAQVLAGQFTLGNSSMTRPPSIPVYASTNSHSLYDSCVNSVSKPDIFVVFERDQYYPKYLVKYICTMQQERQHQLQHHQLQQRQLQQHQLQHYRQSQLQQQQPQFYQYQLQQDQQQQHQHQQQVSTAGATVAQHHLHQQHQHQHHAAAAIPTVASTRSFDRHGNAPSAGDRITRGIPDIYK